MNTYTLEYSSKEQLESFIVKHSLTSLTNILIQVFTSKNDKNFIVNLRNDILNDIPFAKIIGSTTCGEISNNGSLEDSTIISFSTFDSTIIKTSIIEYTQSSYRTGQDLINSFADNHNEKLELLISFTDGLHTNGEEYLNGISSINDSVIVAGGMAGDNAKFEETFVFTNEQITNKGAVAAAFYGESLNIHTDYSFNWESVGKKHIIEKSDKNRVYRISGMSAVEFYGYYLGDDIQRLLPAIGIEFPLVIKRGGINVARAVLSKHDDGSLSFAGNIEEGAEVQFGHGDVQMIINRGLNNVKNILNYPLESIFIYSCMARRALLQNDINMEMLPLRELAPISGFFTYGEFYHNCEQDNCNTQLLNQTMTILALSEKKDKIEKVSANIFSHNPPKVNDINLHRTQALSNLLERTTKELEELNLRLEGRVKAEVIKNLEKDKMLQMSQTQAQVGEMIEMILHQWRQPLSAITSAVTSAQIYQETDLLDDDTLEDTLIKILSYAEHLNMTIEDFRDLFKSDIKMENIDAKKVVQKTLTIINPLLSKTDIKIDENYNCFSTIYVSSGLLMQVILNIIKNAIDILIEKETIDPKIELNTYKEDENKWVLQIKDNAGGIPEDILPKIFDKRFTTKSSSHGTGLGLNMSKTIIESKLKGSLTAHNEDNYAIFTLKLPI